MVQLEAELKRRNEDLSNERITRANAEAALTSTQRLLHDSEQNALELQDQERTGCEDIMTFYFGASNGCSFCISYIILISCLMYCI